MFIYKITFPNKKVYIGQTTQTLIKRFYGHKNYALAKQDITKFSNGSRVCHAIRKYGLKFDWMEVIDRAKNLEELNTKETYWISQYNSTNINKGYNLNSGGANKLHHPSTKIKIGQATKERWKDADIAKRMKKGLEAGTIAMKEAKGTKKVERLKYVCKKCGKSFLAREKENRKFCSINCSAINAFAIASEKIHQEYLERHKNTKDLVHEWALGNKDIIQKCPLNKISTNLEPLLKITNIYDWRTLTKATCDTESRKDFLLYLKDYVKIYAEPDGK